MNIAEIEMQLADLVKEPFDRNKFALRLLEIYDAPKSTLTKLRKGMQNKGEGPDDLLWARKLYFRSAQVGESAQTLDRLKDTKTAKSQKPRFLVATDGHEVAALDIKADETLHCDFATLNDHFDFFLPLAGIDKYEAVKEQDADIKATGRLAKFHDEILRQNPGWITDEKRHALNQFMTRILFCMFAEDTGSFAKGLFVKTITEFGGDNGEHIHLVLKQIFDVMNVPDKERAEIPAHIRAFPYVNGGLFADQTEVPIFNKRAKRILTEAAQLDWSQINPDIFGSMIQAVVHPDMRGDLGMHYTSVPNIMKVLQPLFLMSLEEELAQAQGHREERSRLNKLLTRISKIRVFDPACGSGNFLIIAYRELRTIEMRIFKRFEELDGGQRSRHWTGVKLSNFYGIELADFAAETAKLSLWIAEYQMNQRFKDLFGQAPPNFPLAAGGHIVCDNALRRDWLEVCPPARKVVQKQKVFDLATIAPVHATEEVADDEAETFVVGNPPYLGSRNQTDDQKADMRLVCEDKIESFKSLDLVCCWYVKASAYCNVTRAEAAFVATNSICQGQHVSSLWPYLFSNGVEIGFAHLPFKWKNSAANNAGVTCVIVGIRKVSSEKKTIYDDQFSRVANNISPYLIDMKTLIVGKESKPIGFLQEMTYGNYPGDGTNLTLNQSEKDELCGTHPEAAPLVRRLYGAQEFLKGQVRYCLWISDDDLTLALSIPFIAERIEKTRQVRISSRDPGYNKLAETPHRYRDTNTHSEYTIIVPTISSERRDYLPVGIIDDGAITTNQVYALHDAAIYHFSVLSSKLHYVWLNAVAGKLESRLRYSSTLVYNTFPLPRLSADQIGQLEAAAWEIVAAREAHAGKTIAWLYDPDTMPEDLLNAHHSLDDTLEKIYIGRPFKNDTERLEHLFRLYGEMTAENEKEAASA